MKTKTVHIVGRKNSGKTTLVVDLVTELTRRGLKVATIKHTHHHHELDVPGKDSHRHREAGAEAVGILAPSMVAVFSAQDPETDATRQLADLVAHMPPCDLILVEGGQFIRGDKVEVWRREVTELPLAHSDQEIHALVTDDSVDGFERPVWPRSDLAAVVSGILAIGGLADS